MGLPEELAQSQCALPRSALVCPRFTLLSTRLTCELRVGRVALRFF